jgi:hypothetical protein
MSFVLALAGLLAGCSSHYAPSAVHQTPQVDPADYHGVPTDDRPPILAPASGTRVP